MSCLNLELRILQSVMEYEEHEKRAWSVDFSCTDPSMLVSGSDDCKVCEVHNHNFFVTH